MSTYPKKLLELVKTAVGDLFASTGATGYAADAAAAKLEGDTILAASLGFSGTQLKGAVVFLCDRAVLAATSPQREFKAQLDDADCADWCGEIANQIVGNLKRLVAGYDVEILLSTPTVVKGRDLMPASSRGKDEKLWFKLGAHTMMLQLNAELAPGVTFEGEPKAVEQAGSGDALLF